MSTQDMLQPLPGQGRLQLLLLLGQLHLELGDLGLQVSNLLVEITGLTLQLPFQLLQLLPVLLLLLQPHYNNARGPSAGGSHQEDAWRVSLPAQALHTEEMHVPMPARTRTHTHLPSGNHHARTTILGTETQSS